ncbi:MAG: hypothetical protein IRZ16_17930 [Myxococcaceae bacterium]|nr:hypothetical protein [Myxococcaceae bacterium]
MDMQKLMVTACLIGLSAGTGCDTAAHAPGAEAAVTRRDGHAHPMMVEWKTVDTFEQLLGASDLVVLGTVVDRRFVTERLYPFSREKGRRLTAKEAGQEYGELQLIESTVQIDQVLRHSDRAEQWKSGDTVVVSELGGKLDDGCLAVPDDKPPLEKGDDVVLYLSAAGKPGVFHQVGGWQGRMYVADGVVHPLAARVHPQSQAVMPFDGMSLDALLAEVATRPAAPLPELQPPGPITNPAP